MVVLPYKDSLLLFSRYLQQLVMESIGKEFDLDGNRVLLIISFQLLLFEGGSDNDLKMSCLFHWN